MTTHNENTHRLHEELAAELTEAAVGSVSRHAAHGVTVEEELELWKALGAAVDTRRRSREGLVAELTDAAYRVALGHGLRDAFVDVQLDLWEAICLTVRSSRLAAQLFPATPTRRTLAVAC